MIDKIIRIKGLLALFLITAFCMTTMGAVVSDNDGSAFITKAEFDSLKNNFQSQIDQYNTSIDSKIDGAIASYLNGLRYDVIEEIKGVTDAIKDIRFYAYYTAPHTSLVSENSTITVDGNFQSIIYYPDIFAFGKQSGTARSFMNMYGTSSASARPITTTTWAMTTSVSYNYNTGAGNVSHAAVMVNAWSLVGFSYSQVINFASAYEHIHKFVGGAYATVGVIPNVLYWAHPGFSMALSLGGGNPFAVTRQYMADGSMSWEHLWYSNTNSTVALRYSYASWYNGSVIRGEGITQKEARTCWRFFNSMWYNYSTCRRLSVINNGRSYLFSDLRFASSVCLPVESRAYEGRMVWASPDFSTLINGVEFIGANPYASVEWDAYYFNMDWNSINGSISFSHIQSAFYARNDRNTPVPVLDRISFGIPNPLFQRIATLGEWNNYHLATFGFEVGLCDGVPLVNVASTGYLRVELDTAYYSQYLTQSTDINYQALEFKKNMITPFSDGGHGAVLHLHNGPFGSLVGNGRTLKLADKDGFETTSYAENIMPASGTGKFDVYVRVNAGDTIYAKLDPGLSSKGVDYAQITSTKYTFYSD